MGHSRGVNAQATLCRDGLGTVQLDLVLMSFHQLAQILASTVFFLYQLVQLLYNMHTCELTPFATPCVVQPT